MDTCGFVDKEYQGAFGGHQYEGDPRSLIYDVFCCQICDEPAHAPSYFPKEYIEEIGKEHGHGHGYII